MTYATQQDLIDRFGAEELIQLTDRTNIPVSTIDPVVVDRALSDASELIDGYLKKVVKLPLSPVPGVLVKTASDIARYYLHGKAADKDNPVTRAYNEAVGLLRDVSRGLVELAVDGEAPPAAGGGSVQAVAPNRVFTRDSLRDF
ncbi:gp436 family protein [Neorhizobium petrolearium]|uniref:gp436 family protein n=1 Tax=Neorhizobium petrolearium TaxID=515361 RepID=UPI003F7F405C